MLKCGKKKVQMLMLAYAVFYKLSHNATEHKRKPKHKEKEKCWSLRLCLR